MTPVTPDSEFLANVRAQRANIAHLGIEMMSRWNWFARQHPLGPSAPGAELAVMGHQEDSEYKFIVQVSGKTFECTLKELAEE